MATAELSSSKTPARILNMKIEVGSKLEERIDYVCGSLDISGSELVRRAVDAYLAANGQ